MDKREARAAEASKHLALMKVAFSSDTQKSIEETINYQDGEGRSLAVPEPRFDRTATDARTTMLVQTLRSAKGHVAVVDPASFTRPGGAYVEGSYGPEQQLCAESNLYPILEAMRNTYHEPNKQERHGGLLSDHALFIPAVKFLRNGDVRNADVIVVAAPNRTRALEAHRSEQECDTDLRNRIETIMRIAAANEVETLVVNAFGCGIDGNDPKAVAQIFRTWLDEHPGVLKAVLFSTRRGAEEDAFAAFFAAPKEEVVSVEVDEDEDEEEFSIDDLPEGVTFRR